MKKTGFTLIEILIVVSIIGILAALIVGNFLSARERAADGAMKGELGQLKTALQLYYNDNQSFPSSLPAEDQQFSDNGTTYMGSIPRVDYYEQLDSGDDFLSCSGLERAADDQKVTLERCDVDESVVETLASEGRENPYCVCAD
ncbi:MAG: prepilin-type N-terminal cleavage/methylation domain-containing protein [Pseudomonadales bacterium]|nr:prepilin-type N-terminal cleavage/methylation domain-containing protein [Candidatus Woesebacteria bacterium]MCB9801876.1 prepilin-type N-terminal cleavage/methylation domain-containing protein [Pseudomonadales bacterium]